MHFTFFLPGSRKKRMEDSGAVLNLLRSGNVKKLKKLHINGHDLVAKVDGEVPLYHACAAGQVDAVKFLLSVGAVSEHRRCVAVAPSTRKGQQVRKLLIRYESSRRPRLSQADTDGGCSAEVALFGEVFVAAKTGDVEKLRSLARQGKNIWVEHPTENRTPLFYASAGAHVEAVEYLLNSGAQDSDFMCELVAPDGPRGDTVKDMLRKHRMQRASQNDPITRMLAAMPSLDPNGLTCSTELPGELEPCLDAIDHPLPNVSEHTPLHPSSSELHTTDSQNPHLNVCGEQPSKAGSPATSCCVCWESAAKYACIPCGHLCLCRECWETIQNSSEAAKCPICRKDTSHALEIFRV